LVRGAGEESSRRLGDEDRARPETRVATGALALRLRRLRGWAVGERARRLTWLCDRGHATDGLRLRRGLKLFAFDDPVDDIDERRSFDGYGLRLRRGLKLLVVMVDDPVGDIDERRWLHGDDE
jgi:hypothetical protein